MIVYSLLLVTLATALLSLFLLWRKRNLSFGGRWPYLLLSATLAMFIYLYGVWVFISVYGKYVFAGCYVVFLLADFFRKNKMQANTPAKSTKFTSILVSIVLLLLVGLYYKGTAGKPYGTVDLQLPFKRGTYFVFQGGRGLPTNVFHATGRGTLFAIDIIKLNKYGNRADHVFSKSLPDYEIFGDTIYSPCNGVVVKTESDNPDNIPPLRKRGLTNTNQVLIESSDAYIFLGHLKKGSVLVKAGDKITMGQPLGLAGNSGMSLEPHLHIQAHAKTNVEQPWYRQPQLQILLSGKSYLLFEEIKPLDRR